MKCSKDCNFTTGPKEEAVSRNPLTRLLEVFLDLELTFTHSNRVKMGEFRNALSAAMAERDNYRNCIRTVSSNLESSEYIRYCEDVLQEETTPRDERALVKNAMLVAVWHLKHLNQVCGGTNVSRKIVRELEDLL